MTTPISDFVKKYASQNKKRLHMPGHKGQGMIGVEKYDITEIGGADSLYEASGIIAESEANASRIFGCKTLYSTEGSSQCIRAMIYLACVNAKDRPLILAGRNAHKTFLTAAAMLDCEVEWLCPQNGESYLACTVTADYLEKKLISSEQKPAAVYITSPDYLGNVADVEGLSSVCRRFGVPLMVDNAHGAYLKFFPESKHPIDLGADICCDSAHKTLPVLTGGAYLHISPDAPAGFALQAKNALALFGSTSPSYLILQSLDLANPIMENFAEEIKALAEKVAEAKNIFAEKGFAVSGSEPLKLTVSPKSVGYTGVEFADYCEQKGFVCEFADEDYVVFMFAPNNGTDMPIELASAVADIEKKTPLTVGAPEFRLPEKAMTIRQAALSASETIPVTESEGRILAVPTVGCPPAVPIAACGEKIDKNTIERFLYYGITECTVVK
ncbi:MAG: PLP-dependent transferase [Clostridia bacterium]|nr:PLP-dependent transferase [Clostridia bacterium]